MPVKKLQHLQEKLEVDGIKKYFKVRDQYLYLEVLHLADVI